MSEKVILTDEQIERYGNALDGLVDFTKFGLKYKFLGIFNIDVGNFLEKIDGKIFKAVLGLLNTFYAEGKISDDAAELLTNIFANIDSSDETDLVKVVMTFIVDKCLTSSSDITKEAIVATAGSIASNFSTLLDQLNAQMDTLVAEADA